MVPDEVLHTVATLDTHDRIAKRLDYYLSQPRVLELCMIQGPLQWAILAEEPRLEDGHLVFPEKSGLGVTLAENLEVRFPYLDGDFRVTVHRENVAPRQ